MLLLINATTLFPKTCIQFSDCYSEYLFCNITYRSTMHPPSSLYEWLSIVAIISAVYVRAHLLLGLLSDE